MTKLLKKTVEMIDTNIIKPIEEFSIQGRYKIIGSNSYRVLRYANDYDIQTDIKGNNMDYLEKITQHFKKQFVKAKSSQNIWITDFKCGMDERLSYFGDYTDASIQDYIKNPYLSEQQIKTILDGNETERIEFIKSLFVLRWSYNDIIKGYKILFDGTKKVFKDCLLDKTIMKIDLLLLVGNQIAEISENYTIKIGSKTNQVKFSSKDLQQSLQYDIDKYRKTNSFKSLKRLYSLFLLEGEKKNRIIINKLIDFFNSQVGALYQIKSELDVLTVAREQKFRLMPFEIVYNNLQFIKTQISKVFSIPIDDSVFESINEVTDQNADSLIEKLSEYFTKKVNDNSKDFLKSLI